MCYNPRVAPAPTIESASPFMCARLPSLPRAAKGASMGQLVLLTPPKSSHPRSLLYRQQSAPISPLAATLMRSPVSVVNKELTGSLSPLDSALTKNRGVGGVIINRISGEGLSSSVE